MHKQIVLTATLLMLGSQVAISAGPSPCEGRRYEHLETEVALSVIGRETLRREKQCVFTASYVLGRNGAVSDIQVKAEELGCSYLEVVVANSVADNIYSPASSSVQCDEKYTLTYHQVFE